MFLGAQTLQIIGDAASAAAVPGVVPMGAGNHRHLHPRQSISREKSQSLGGGWGLQRAGEGAGLRGSGRKHSWTISDQKAFGILTLSFLKSQLWPPTKAGQFRDSFLRLYFNATL